MVEGPAPGRESVIAIDEQDRENVVADGLKTSHADKGNRRGNKSVFLGAFPNEINSLGRRFVSHQPPQNFSSEINDIGPSGPLLFVARVTPGSKRLDSSRQISGLCHEGAGDGGVARTGLNGPRDDQSPPVRWARERTVLPRLRAVGLGVDMPWRIGYFAACAVGDEAAQSFPSDPARNNREPLGALCPTRMLTMTRPRGDEEPLTRIESGHRVSLLTDGELARLLGSQIQLWRAAKELTPHALEAEARVAQGAIADLELGGGSVRDLVAVARALGIVPALLDAMRPQPRTLDELERVEIARLNARPGEIDD
jgi:hypothetical protein